MYKHSNSNRKSQLYPRISRRLFVAYIFLSFGLAAGAWLFPTYSWYILGVWAFVALLNILAVPLVALWLKASVERSLDD